jgi:RimJ/RimL family protein N-acetyltransferase/ubiquinone/menaquinone biosynthesis C-methylase UbiE
LRVGPWQASAQRAGLDLGEMVAELLTARTTVALPVPWQGDFSLERARAWIAERDGESPTLLVEEAASGRPVGFAILAEVPLDESTVDVRIGYIIAEESWGRGLATELLSGLIDWAWAQPSIHTLTGGVDLGNPASVRVLENCGFHRISESDEGTATYQLNVERDNEWDMYARNWDDDGAARAYAAAAFSSLQEVPAPGGIRLEGANVIDFGCGTGLLTERLVAAGARVEAVDTSTAMLGVLRTKVAERGWASVETGTGLPPDRVAFDLVVCSSVCLFLDDYPGTVAELVTRLRPGGFFVQWDWERTDEDPHGFTKDEIQSVLTRSGLIDVEVRAGFEVLADAQRMSPLMGYGRRPPDPETHPTPHDQAHNAPE